MHTLEELLKENENWLMRRILEHAKRHDYTKYTSTLEEAWRLSISGLTNSIAMGIRCYDDVPELEPDEDYKSDPLAQFGVVEAKRHRERGVTLTMFLGLMKYYRLSYLELLSEKRAKSPTLERDKLFIERCFDRIELAFCQEWSDIRSEEHVDELQNANRVMTNEKNAYLTVFESLKNPVIMLDANGILINMNHSASLLVEPEHIPGGQHYHPEQGSDDSQQYGKREIDTACIGHPAVNVFPCLASTLKYFSDHDTDTYECRTTVSGMPRMFEVRLSDMLDVSEKYVTKIIVLQDITNRKESEDRLINTVRELGKALSEVKRLSGLLPICANCKKVRDDDGYWQQVEQYIMAKTDATFSHGICPECQKELYSDPPGPITAITDPPVKPI